MATVAVTRLRLRGARYLPLFLWHTLRSFRQSRAAAGNLTTLARRARGAFWTITVWRDKAAMRDFMLGGAHRGAMPHLQHWCDEASLTQWEQDGPAPPTWTEAERRLAAEGRLSHVKHPSPAQTRGATLGSSEVAP